MPVYRQLGGADGTISFAITRGASLGTRSFTASGLLYRGEMGVLRRGGIPTRSSSLYYRVSIN